MRFLTTIFRGWAVALALAMLLGLVLGQDTPNNPIDSSHLQVFTQPKLMVGAWNDFELNGFQGSVLSFEATTFLYPQDSLGYLRRVQGRAAALGIHAILLRVVEFLPGRGNPNGTLGYRPGEDRVLATYSLSDAERHWRPFVYRTVQTRDADSGIVRTVHNTSCASEDGLVRIDFLLANATADKPGAPAALRNSTLYRDRLQPYAITAQLTLHQFPRVSRRSRLAVALAVGSAEGQHLTPANYSLNDGLEQGIDLHLDLGQGDNPAAGRVRLDGRAIGVSVAGLQVGRVIVSNTTQVAHVNGSVWGTPFNTDLSFLQYWITLPLNDARTPSYAWTYSLQLANPDEVADFSAAGAARPTLFVALAAVVIAAILCGLA